jgi:two-component system NarL family sensor kinase
MAAIFLGPAPAFAVALVSEVGAWLVDRFDPVALISNCLASIGPTLLASALAQAAGADHQQGVAFDGIVACAATLALATNAVIAAFLMALCRGRAPAALLRASGSLAPLLALNVALSVLVAEAYSRIGIEASVFVLVLILVFSYTVRLLTAATERSRRVAELSESRGLLVAQALNAEDRERRNLAEWLHDGAVQNLLAARQDIEEAELGARESLTRAQATIERTVEQLRDAVFDLHPAVLDHAGLPAALAAIAEKESQRGRFRVHLAIDPAATGPTDQLVFSICKELLINAAKHSRARDVAMTVSRTNADILIEVTDDGVGFKETDRHSALEQGHIGLASSAERVDASGGTFEIVTMPGQGTKIRVTVPAVQRQPTVRDGTIRTAPT